MPRKLTRSGRLIQGVGINDADYVCSRGKMVNGKWVEEWSCKVMETWKSMLNRCYSVNHQKTHPTYADCSVCDEWKIFSNFKRWMEKQDWEGKHLDKDLLVRGNKVYSPISCVFVPSDVNQIVVHKKQGNLPLGISFDPSRGLYGAYCNISGKRQFLGRSEDPLSAHFMWVKAKLLRIDFLKEKYKRSYIDAALFRVKTDLESALLNREEVTSL